MSRLGEAHEVLRNSMPWGWLGLRGDIIDDLIETVVDALDRAGLLADLGDQAAVAELATARDAVEAEGGCVEVRDGRLVPHRCWDGRFLIEHRCEPWWRRWGTR